MLDRISDDKILGICRETIGQKYADNWSADFKKRVIDVVRFGISLIPRIRGVEKEMLNLLTGYQGQYIEPGPSGSVIRGKLDVLPTGRNFYSVDPMRLPTPAAWEVGVKLAHALIDIYRKENDSAYPENIGFVEWCIDPFRADGEGIAQILYTIGTKPVWDETGVVTGIEVIPLEELGRPRIDTTCRVDGIFRDTMPNLMELLDKAFQKIADLDESDEENFVKKHVQESMKTFLKDHDRETAFRRATYRVFSEKPGAYGAGANLAVLASAWKEKKDLAEVWIDWGSFAYGKGVYGESAPSEMVSLLKSVNLTYQKLESDDFDTLDCCCFFSFQGGFTCAAETISGEKVSTYFGDSRDPNRPEVRDMKDEMERTVRSRLLNPAWIEGKKRHGYKGASEISQRIERVYGWSATAGIVDKWIYDAITETFVMNDEMRQWFKDNNPWAFEEMARRLLEAVERKLYEADEEHIRELKEVYLEIEGVIEEKLGDVEGEFQGGEITILTKDDVKSWDDKVKGKIEKWKKVVET